MILSKSGSVLVIDDQFSIRTSIHFVLDKEYDVVILDLSLEGIMGIEGLKMIKEYDPCISVIILTGYGSLKTAQEAIRYRANDYIIKPFNTEEMRKSVKRCCKFTAREREKEDLLASVEEVNIC
jgi:DNA-binding NtrC family response regulator